MRKIAKRICAMILATTMLTSMFSLSSISAFAKETEVQTQAEVQTEAEDNEPDNQLGEFEIPSGKTGDLTLVEEKEYEGSVDVINTPAEYYKAINKGSNLIRNVSNLPDSIDNSKTKYFPPIGDQNPLGACTAWANVYYQFSYEINRKLDRTATSENSFSPKFVYNLINNGVDKGSGSYTAYDVLSEYGAPSLESVPYDYDYLTWSFDEDVWKEASQYKLKSYQVINIPNTGVDITSPDDSDLTTIKTAIANGDVLTFSTYVRSWTYRNLKINPEAPENSKISNCLMVSEMAGNEGAHRMTIVGYNDDIWIDINSNDKIDDGEMGAFKVANSWGTNETFSGYYYVAYDALNRFSSVRGYKNPAERRPIFESISRIDVEATNPVSDFSLRYTVNSATRIKSEIKIVAERFGTKTEVKLPPYSHLMIFWDTVDHSYNGTDTASDATFYANLSDYIPEINSDNISEYSISVLFSDTEADSKSLTVKNVELIDNRNNKIYRPSNFSTFKIDGAEKSVNILKSTERAVEIYYKGYHNPKIEYKTENGSWTPAPGKAMEVYIEKSGYTHKYAVELDDAEDFVYVRFNDGKGVYDNNNGSYYTAYAGENYFTTAGIKQPEIDINILTDMPSNRIMPAFQSATFTIDANGGYGTYTYTYNYKCISGNYKYTLSDRDFNSHVTSFYEEGDYVFTVTVEDAVGNIGTATYEYTVKKLDPEFEYFISRPDSNVYVGELVNFFALLNPVNSPEYEFEIYNFNFGYFEKGSEVEEYHHDNGKRYLHSTWTPQATGTYYIYLTVKDSRGKTKTETLVLNVSLPPLQIESIDLSKEDVAYYGDIIDINVEAKGGTGEIEYKILCLNRGTENVLQDYSSNKTVSYDIGFWGGDCIFSVIARDAAGNVAMAQKELAVIAPVFEITSFSKDSATTNETITINSKLNNISQSLAPSQLKYFYYIDKDGVNEETIKTSDLTLSWTPKKVGKYTIVVYALYYITDNGGFLLDTAEYEYEVVYKDLTLESFEVSPDGKGGFFEIVNMTANAIGGTGELEYQFYYTKYGQKYILQDYSTKNTASYQFGIDMGDYPLSVSVRDSLGNVVISKQIKYTVVQTYITELSLSNSSVRTNETVVITPVINNDSSVLKAEHYKYTVTKDGVTETLTTSADETATWIPKETGTYKIQLEIRYNGTLVSILSRNFVVNDIGIGIESFELSPKDKGGAFEILNMTANAKGGTGNLEYQFYYIKNGQKYIVQDYSTKNTASYQFGIDMGDYPFYVDVRDAEGYVVTSEQKEFTVVQTYIKNFTFSNDSAGIGETVVITPVINNDSSVLKAEHYKYTVTKDGVPETLTTSADETASWTPKEIGTYKIQLEIRYNDTLVSIKSCDYVVDRVGIVIDNFTVTPDSNLGMYEKINVSANATGGIGTLEYQFVYAKNSIEYIIQDYSSKNTATAQLNDTGYYTIAVNVKDSKGNIVKTEKQIYVNYPYISDFSYNTTSAKAGETVVVTPMVRYEASVLTADDYVYKVSKGGVTETIKASADKTLNWTPKEAGDYTIKLELYYGDSYITSLTRNYTVAEAPIKENNIYLIPSSEWKQANARFAMYMWGDNVDGKFVSMTANSDGVYSAPLADGYDKVIFVRMNPATTENNWSNKWNQSVDLTVQSGKNCFTVNSGEWEGANGTWSVYFDVEPTEPNTTVPPTTVPVTTVPVTTQPITTIPVTTVPPTPSPVVDDNIYFIPSNNWKESNARFAVYAWGDNVSGTFTSMTANSEGVYSAKLADGCNKVIFVRMNPATTENNWSNKWNQTADLTVQSGKNCFTVNSGEWEGANGTWSVYSVVDPTEPNTTVPVTTVPTTTPTLPVDEVSVFGDINLLLEETEANIYTGSVELQAGTYKFNLNNKGTTHGTNYTYTDTATIDYSAGYKAQTTLKVSGGRYTFTFNASTKKLTIKFKSFDDIVELVGDINAELVRPNKNTTVFTGTIRLEAGTYKFNVNEHGELFGLNNKFTDSIYNIPFIYKSEATFVATGGVYSVRYDTSNNQLKVLQAPAGLGDVTIFGDISLPLASQGNGVYSAQTILDAGSYDIRVDSFGTFFGNGTEFTNTVNVEFKTEWKAAATLKVSEKMKFTFIFDSNTNKVKVFNAPIDTTKVKVAFDDIDALVLTSVDGVTYTATTTLDAGTYTFRMDEFGTPMGGKYTFTDSANNLVYNASYASATTMIAIGGEYKFSYNVNTNQLTVFRYNNEGKVSIYGDIELDLSSLSGGRYIGSIELTSGTYTFRINDFGTPMCYDGTFTDTIPNAVFTSDCRKSTTFIVTGGKYSFYYDQVTNVVSVSKS